MRRYLLLEDGNIFEGEAFGSLSEISGEIIFTTSPTGYYEVLTDPSYGGQIVLFTFPSIFTYNFKNSKPQGNEIAASGIIIREL
ncbi:MAG: carbamoyl-phosphate synthase domain-containing protein, partial [Thermoplasmataceae archaeon]